MPNMTQQLLCLQTSSSAASLSGAAGQSSAGGGTDYLKSALDASANQKESFFARKMEVKLGMLFPFNCQYHARQWSDIRAVTVVPASMLPDTSVVDGTMTAH